MSKEFGDIEGIKYFKKQDFVCKDRCGLGFDDIDLEIVKLVDLIRDKYGQPILINSSLRCPKHNYLVDGDRFSYHLAVPGRLKGQALDIRPHDQKNLLKLKSICDTMNPNGGVGLKYAGFVHIDSRGIKARW